MDWFSMSRIYEVLSIFAKEERNKKTGLIL